MTDWLLAGACNPHTDGGWGAAGELRVRSQPGLGRKTILSKERKKGRKRKERKKDEGIRKAGRERREGGRKETVAEESSRGLCMCICVHTCVYMGHRLMLNVFLSYLPPFHERRSL